MTTRNKKAASQRTRDLKHMLEERHRELTDDVEQRIREVRADGGQDRGGLDDGETSESDVQRDIGLALLQIKVEALNGITAAMRRLEHGTYGDCLDCGAEIHEARLRALPFAIRCRECAEAEESAARQRGALSPARHPFLAQPR
jgi:DnaK suppressor protein